MPELSAVCVAAPPYPSTLCRLPIFSARAPVSLLNKQQPSPLYIFNRVTSKFSPTPSARKPISPLGFERLPRVNSSARAPVPVPNKQELLVPYIFNRATSIFSHSVRLALRRCIAAHETASHPRLASKPEVAAHACFFCLTAARGLLPCLLPPRAFFCLSSGVARRFVVGRVLPRLVAGCVTAAARGQRSEIGRERGKQAKIGFFALNRAKTR